MIKGHQMGVQHDEGELSYLRGLKLADAGDADPPVDAGGGGHDVRHHQQRQGDDPQHPRKFMQHMVVDGGNHQHGHHAQNGKGQLALDEVIAVAVVPIEGVGIAGRIHAHQADNQDQHEND